MREEEGRQTLWLSFPLQPHVQRHIFPDTLQNTFTEFPVFTYFYNAANIPADNSGFLYRHSVSDRIPTLTFTADTDNPVWSAPGP